MIPLRLALLLTLLSSSSALAQSQPPRPTLPPALPEFPAANDPVSQVHALLASLKTDPNRLANWVLLGDAAERVALEQGGDSAPGWLVLSRRAFESALLLDPENPHLKAAILRVQAEKRRALAPPRPSPRPSPPVFTAPGQPRLVRRPAWRRFFEPDPSLLRPDADMPMYRAGVRGGLDQSPAQPEIP